MTTINKGHLTEDKAYIYTCHNCAGQNPDCPYCYGLNTERILAEMKKGAQGQRYYALLKAFLSVQGQAMVQKARDIQQAQGGKLLVYDIGYLSLHFGLNLKATWEWLSEAGVVASGSYEFALGHLKVRDIYALARRKYHLEEPDA